MTSDWLAALSLAQLSAVVAGVLALVALLVVCAVYVDGP